MTEPARYVPVRLAFRIKRAIEATRWMGRPKAQPAIGDFYSRS
jgi:hypothetical protein